MRKLHFNEIIIDYEGDLTKRLLHKNIKNILSCGERFTQLNELVDE